MHPSEASEAPLDPSVSPSLPLGEWFIRRALGLNQVRSRRLIRLGLLPRRATDLESLREAYGQVLELERRVAEASERLAPAELHGALAWLVQIAGAGPDRTSAEVRARVSALLDRLDQQRQ